MKRVIAAALVAGLTIGAAEGQECQQRVGPFVTQSTAWQRFHQAQSQGYSVSTGVFPCWSGDTRGYCFNVFLC
jgi:hypothetical protein